MPTSVWLASYRRTPICESSAKRPDQIGGAAERILDEVGEGLAVGRIGEVEVQAHVGALADDARLARQAGQLAGELGVDRARADDRRLDRGCRCSRPSRRAAARPRPARGRRSSRAAAPPALPDALSLKYTVVCVGARVVAPADRGADLALGLARQRARAALGLAEDARPALQAVDRRRGDRAVLADADDAPADAGDRVGVQRRVARLVGDDLGELLRLVLAVEGPRDLAVALDLDAALGVGALRRAAGAAGVDADLGARGRSRTPGRSRRRPAPSRRPCRRPCAG